MRSLPQSNPPAGEASVAAYCLICVMNSQHWSEEYKKLFVLERALVCCEDVKQTLAALCGCFSNQVDLQKKHTQAVDALYKLLCTQNCGNARKFR